MEERVRRVALNEAMFRTVNDEVHGLNERFAVIADPMSVVCECGSAVCTERIELRAAEYEQLRRDPTHFAVKPGHELPDLETVVERHEGYLVVQKPEGETADLVRRADTSD